MRSKVLLHTPIAAPCIFPIVPARAIPTLAHACCMLPVSLCVPLSYIYVQINHTLQTFLSIFKPYYLSSAPTAHIPQIYQLLLQALMPVQQLLSMLYTLRSAQVYAQLASTLHPILHSTCETMVGSALSSARPSNYNVCWDVRRWMDTVLDAG